MKHWLISRFSCNERISLCILHACSAVRVFEDCSAFTSINIAVLQKVLCNLERLVTFWFQPYFLPLSPVSLLFCCSSHLSFSLFVSSLFIPHNFCHVLRSLTRYSINPLPVCFLCPLAFFETLVYRVIILLLSQDLPQLSASVSSSSSSSILVKATLQLYLFVHVICGDPRPQLHHMVHWDIRWAVSTPWYLMPQSSSTHLPAECKWAPGKEYVCVCVSLWSK